MSHGKILGTVLEMNQRKTSTNGPENKKTNNNSSGPNITEMTLTGYRCVAYS